MKYLKWNVFCESRNVFKTESDINDGAFLEKQLTAKTKTATPL